MLFEARPELNYRIHITYDAEELKAHEEFRAQGNAEKLDRLLSDSRQAGVFEFVQPGRTHIDIELAAAGTHGGGGPIGG